MLLCVLANFIIAILVLSAFIEHGHDKTIVRKA